MNIKFIKIRNKVKDTYVYDKNKYYILLDNTKVGTINFIKTNKVFFIKGMYLDKEHQKKGIGTMVINYILNHYDIKFIVGETLFSSRGFWSKMIRKYNGVRRNINYSENCSSTFIIPKGDCRPKDIHNHFGDNCNLYFFLEDCVESNI